MIEAVLVVSALALLLAYCIQISHSAATRLDAIYASRNLAFSRAMQGCVQGPTTSAGSIDDFKTPPGSADPNAERLMGAVGDGIQVSAWGMDIAESSADVTVGDPPRVRFHSQSWVGCVALNHGANRPGLGSSDPSRIQNQIFAIFPYVWQVVEPWLDLHF